MLTSILAIINLVAGDIKLPPRIQSPVIRLTQQYAPKKVLINFASVDKEFNLPSPAILPKKKANFSPNLVKARRAILVDLESAQVLYEKNSNQRAAVASLTKLMTALVSLDLADSLDQTLTVPVAINNLEEGSSLAGFKAGQKYRVRDLLTAMMVGSANDAALTLAWGLSGSEEKFVAAMNIKAAQMGLNSTLFANATGLDTAGAYSTAHDIAFLLMQAQKNPLLQSYSQISNTFIYDQQGEAHYLQATDKLIGQKNINIVTAKTGFTDLAGQSFAVMAANQGHNLIAVVLDSPDRFSEAQDLLSEGFDNYSWRGGSPLLPNAAGVGFGG